MIQSYKTKANLGIAVGLVIHIASRMVVRYLDQSAGSISASALATIFLAGLVVGTAIFVWGCVMYARAKDRNGWWGAFGLLSLIGLIVLVCLKDHAPDGFQKQTRGFDPIMRR